MHPDRQTFPAARLDGEGLLRRVDAAVARLREALGAEARRFGPGDAFRFGDWLQRGSCRRAELAFALGFALGAGEDWLAPPALAVELVHAATLLHDDLIDGDAVRRDMPALWKAASPRAAVLSGDFLLCRALEVLSRSPRAGLVPLFARAVSRVCRGEIRQDFPAPGTAAAPPRAEKTAPLFAFATAAAAPRNAPPALVRALARTGWRLGDAFQARDDDDDGDAPPAPLPSSPRPLHGLLAPWPAARLAARHWLARHLDRAIHETTSGIPEFLEHLEQLES